MSAIFILINHSVTAIIEVTFFEIESNIFVFICHPTIYLLIFLILLPPERKIFINLLPQENFFDNQPYGKYIVALPFIIISGTLILWIDNNLFHSWQERISRLYLPVTFFLFHRYVLTANTQIFKKFQAERNSVRLKEQLSTLEEYNSLMQKNQRQLSIMRHDMRYNFRLIYVMLLNGKVSEVLEHIKIQENFLELTSVKVYCYSPLVNAALSIYFQKAEQIGARVKNKINLPEKLHTNEIDFAILISNLLENAIEASKLQEENRREISVTIEHVERQCVLEITNLFDYEILLGDDGLPVSKKIGHGIGIMSLKNFVEKYHAHLEFFHENREVKFMIYWEDF